MSFLGDIAGGLIGAVGDIFGAGMSASSAKDSAAAGYDFQREVYQNRHQWEVEDLRNAGLNPILSATSSSGGSGSAVSSAYDYSSSVNNALNGFINLARMKADIKNIESNTAKNNSDIDLNNKSLDNLSISMVNSAKDGLIKDEELRRLKVITDQAKETLRQMNLDTRSKQIDVDRKERDEGVRTNKRFVNPLDVIYQYLRLGR